MTPPTGNDLSRLERATRLPKTWLLALGVALAIVLLALLPAFGIIHLPGQPDRRAHPPSGASGSWNQVFSEDFDTAATLGQFLDVYGSSFSDYPYPWTDTSRTVRSNPGYYNTAKTVSAENGYLDVWLHYDTQLSQYLVAALLPKLPTMQYGKFALRLSADTTRGYRISPLLWPDSDNFPQDGEIDMPEGPLNGSNFAAFSHYAQPAGTPGPFQDSFPTGVNGSAWHDYEIEWSPGQVEFLVDGQSVGVATKAIPSEPMHWVLQFETIISASAPPQSAQGHVRIDWLQAWQWSD